VVVTIGNIAIAGMLIIGVLCIIVLGIAAIVNTDGPVAVGIIMTCFILWIICAGTAAFTHLFFSDDYSKHKLEYLITTKHEQLVKQCPNEEGLCRLNWLDYRADSLKAEYRVQRAEFDD
jgi:hypothetical protein